MFTSYIQLVQNYKQIHPKNFIERLKKKKTYKNLSNMAMKIAKTVPIDNDTIDDFANSYTATKWMIDLKYIEVIKDILRAYNTINIYTNNRILHIYTSSTYFKVTTTTIDKNNKREFFYESNNNKLYGRNSDKDYNILKTIEGILRSVFQDYLLKLLDTQEDSK